MKGRILIAVSATMGVSVATAVLAPSWGHPAPMAKATPFDSSLPEAPIASPTSQPAARLFADEPLREQLAKGLVVIRYRTENVRIMPVFGAAALEVSPRIGHLHVTVDDAPWHWVDASGEPLVVQGLPAGRHEIRIELADPTHRVIDRVTVGFEIPTKTPSH